MGMIRLIAAPIRIIARSRLFQFAVVIGIILLLDYYSYDYALLREIAEGLKKLVAATVQLCSEYFRVGVLTDPVLQVGLMIAYVYLVCLLILFLLRVAVKAMVDLVGWSNFLWLRNTIARERGIAAYRAWVPFERIRPAGIPQEKWEEAFAWPADNRPPYPPLARRVIWTVMSYVIVVVVIAVLFQIFTPFPVLTWLGRLTHIWVG
jgi:hypothetical protein